MSEFDESSPKDMNLTVEGTNNDTESTETSEKFEFNLQGFEKCPVGNKETIQKAMGLLPPEIQKFLLKDVVFKYSETQPKISKSEYPQLVHMENENINAHCYPNRKPPEIIFYPAAFKESNSATPNNKERAKHAEYVLFHEIGHLLKIPANLRENWQSLLDQLPKEVFSKHASGAEQGSKSKVNEMWADWMAYCMKHGKNVLAQFSNNAVVSEAYNIYEQALENTKKRILEGESEEDEEYDDDDEFEVIEGDLDMPSGFGGSAGSGEGTNSSGGKGSGESGEIAQIFEQYIDDSANKTAETFKSQ